MLFRRNIFRRFFAGKSTIEADLVVIGAGPGGYVAAIKAAQLGLRTVVVERRAALGGTCLNVGCIPSKALLQSSHLYHQAQHTFAKHGIDLSGLSLNLPAMHGQKERAVRSLTDGIAMLFKKNGIQWVSGTASLDGPNRVLVDGGVTASVEAKNIIIATGSDPAPLGGFAIDEERIVTSTGALALQTVPKRLVVVGGGIIGLELGSVWNRLGSQVTVVEYADAIGAGMDGAVAKAFHRILTKQGIRFRLGTKVHGAKRLKSGALQVEMEDRQKETKETEEADVVLVSVGRKPNTEGLALEKVGVALDERGRIRVDEHFKTNIPSIRAIGDVTAGPMLAHKAEEEGIAAVELISQGHGHVNYHTIPSVVYTHPEVAWCGLTEEELRAQGRSYSVGSFPFLANSRAKTVEDTDGFVKILCDGQTDRILGAHIIGPNAGEMIAEAVLAMEYGASSEDVARTCHAHPTLSEAFKEACLSAHGLKKAINM